MRSNHQKNILMLLFTIPVLMFISCGEDSEVFTPYEPTGDIQDYYEATTQDTGPQVFTRNAGDHIVLVTENNTIITIPSNSIVDNEGTIVSGNIRIEVVEVFEKGDMILHKTSTMTGDSYLKSDGMFHIRVTKDGKELKLKEGYNYKIHVPNKEPDPEMKLFYGERVQGMVMWEEADEQDGTLRLNEWQIADSSTVYFDFGYELFCDKFTWINIDKYYDIPEDQKTEVCATLPDELYNGRNTAVFMIYKDEYSLIPLTYDEESHQWCEPYGQVPLGWEIYIVSISSIYEDEYHLGVVEATVTENSFFNILPKIRTKDEIREFLKDL